MVFGFLQTGDNVELKTDKTGDNVVLHFEEQEKTALQILGLQYCFERGMNLLQGHKLSAVAYNLYLNLKDQEETVIV